MSRKKGNKNIKELESNEVTSNSNDKVTSKSKRNKTKGKKDDWSDSDHDVKTVNTKNASSNKKANIKYKGDSSDEDISLDSTVTNSVPNSNKMNNKSKKSKKSKKKDDWSDSDSKGDFKLPSNEEENAIAKPIVKKKGKKDIHQL